MHVGRCLFSHCGQNTAFPSLQLAVTASLSKSDQPFGSFAIEIISV